MTSGTSSPRSAFGWNAGGWFGSTIGCTVWSLILGLVLMPRDPLAAGVCIGAFLALNAWGLFLWRRRSILGAYSANQRFLAVASVLFAVVVVAVNARGLSGPPSPGALVSTYLPYWVIAVAPALMGVFHWRERRVREEAASSRRGSGSNPEP